MRKALLIACFTVFCYTACYAQEITTKKKIEMMRTVERIDRRQDDILKELKKLNDNFERVINALKTGGAK